MRKLTSFAAVAAVVVTSLGIGAAPAEARSRYGGWGHYHRDRIGAGQVLGGLLIIGTIAAIADAASRNARDRRDRDDRRYDPPYPDQRYPDRQPEPRYEPEPDNRGTQPYGNGEAEARATDACSWAVEGEMGDDARVERVDTPQPSDGGWYVTGTASTIGGGTRSFGCTYRGGRVVDVRFG